MPCIVDPSFLVPAWKKTRKAEAMKDSESGREKERSMENEAFFYLAFFANSLWKPNTLS
jgi:hypothetical protein